MSKKGPAAPDPFATAAAQGALNKEAATETARLSRLDEDTPLGSIRFTSTGNDDVPFKRTTTLSPLGEQTFEQQELLGLDLANLARDQFGRISDTLGTPFDLSGIPDAPVADAENRQRVEDSLFDRQLSRLDPRFDDDLRRLETKLANQGIQRGSEAFNNEMERFDRGRNDAVDLALASSIAGGGAEQSRLFNLGTQARGNAIDERAFLRNIPINDINALLSSSQVQIPNFGQVQGIGVGAPDFLGAQSLSLNQGNFRAGQGNSLSNNLFSLGGSLGGAAILSDRRIKKNIKLVGKTVRGYNWYSFDYLDGTPAMGVMADEVPRGTVVTINGIDHVKYGEIV